MEREIDLKKISDGKLYTNKDMVKAGCGECQGCSDCCRGMGNSIFLDPMDIYRLTTGLECTFEDLLSTCVELQVVDGFIQPNMKMTGKEEQCPFLNEKGWITKPLIDMGNCKNGMNFHYNENGCEVKCLGVGDFKDLSIINNIESLQTVSLNEMPSEEYMLRDNDIVFVRSNGNKALVGRSIVIYPGDVPTTFSGFCIRYRKYDDSIIVPYLLHVLKTDSFRNKMVGRGANIQNLNQQILASLIIPVPPLQLQNQFALFVQEIDKSRSRIQKSLEASQELFDSLMQEYFG